MGYEEKIEIILCNKLEYNGNHQNAISEVKTWLGCEWQCGAIESVEEFTSLLPKVDEIAERIIKEL